MYNCLRYVFQNDEPIVEDAKDEDDEDDEEDDDDDEGDDKDQGGADGNFVSSSTLFLKCSDGIVGLIIA